MKNHIIYKLYKESIISIALSVLIMCFTSCEEKPVLPQVSTLNVSDITQTTAVCGGNITYNEGAEITARGVCWGETENPTTSNNKTNEGSGAGTFTSHLTYLTPDTEYSIRAYATNSAGTAYGDIKNFRTLTGIPSVDFTASSTQIMEGESVQFTDLTSNNPTSWSWSFGDGAASTQQNPFYTYAISGIYSVSLTAYNSYGSDTKTRTEYIRVWESEIESGTFIDGRDGNEYTWIKVGQQTWMAENLKYLPRLSPSDENSQWYPSYYVYDFEDTDIDEAKATDNYKIYGVLYNYAAAQNACPGGWHIPRDEEWKQLETYIGMSLTEADYTGYRGTDEGSKLAGNNTLWEDGNLIDNDFFGWSTFMALPGGQHNLNGFFGKGYYGYWWSDYALSDYEWIRRLDYRYSKIYRNNRASLYGLSVRCVKNE